MKRSGGCATKPLVSIIIPVFNVAPYLREALDSVICQTYKNLEILIIDDGSTDSSGIICDEYKADNRVVVIHQANTGLSAARNRGLGAMTGEIVSFLDSDDAYHPDFIKSMVHAMIRENADIVVCKFSHYRTTGRMHYRGKGSASPSIATGTYDRVSSLRALANDELNVSLWNKIYRRNLWNDVRFPEKQVFEEQKTILSIVNECDTLTVIDPVLYKYRIRQGSISNTITVKNRKDLVLAYTQFYSFIKDYAPETFSEEQERKSRQKWICQMIGVYIRCCRQKGDDWERFLNALRKKTIHESEETGTNNPHIRIAIWILRYCPWIFKIAYPVCRPVYRVMRYGASSRRQEDRCYGG